MRAAPKSFRLHIGIFGRRNAGKSSLLNMLTRQETSIVSDTAGTTTDPVEKPMELLPLGPVLFIDTAGIDDEGALGEQRVEKTLQVVDRTDLALLVVGEGRWTEFEERLLQVFYEREIPVIVVFNKWDLNRPPDKLAQDLEERDIPWVATIANRGEGLNVLREALIRTAPAEFIDAPPIIADLVSPGDVVVLVVPIDKEAPKGRLIQPQVQTIRELLDADAYAMVVKERELAAALRDLNRPPALVVTDSQAFLKVAADTPPEVPMTSFSILFARQKGDLCRFVEGALAIDDLKPGDHVLVAEACSHHPILEDIGRVKIPRWLRQYVGGELHFTHVQGHDFPNDLHRYRLLVHCGACMWNRREMLSRMMRCRRMGVPVCNYGMTIAYTLGIFDRALQPFPDAYETYRRLMRERAAAKENVAERD
ncbi:MAG: [FeFe] hydrogenase H-cluster maturation GTPase HydF [Planctomycetota bacterium]|nr:MAG: [FeFe] hydrogenase H-cluster maturation GTPase HydF [Planctomycetota bacterium]